MPGRAGAHYVVVSELLAHKRIDVAIEAFNRLRLPLVVVGDGPAARALIMTTVEEFGIAAVESQAAGRPVIAAAAAVSSRPWSMG